MSQEWLFLADQAVPLMLAAVRAYGPRVLSDHCAGDAAGPEAVGRDLLRVVFGSGDAGLPDVLAELVRRPDDEQASEGLATRASEALEADPRVADEAAGMIAAYHRDRADSGDVQALVSLGDFLYWDDPQKARMAYQEAIDAGHAHALIDLAKLLHRLGEEDAALTAYQQAQDSDDPDLVAEAMYGIAFLHVSHREAEAAAVMFRRLIDTRHPEWAAAAMVGLAGASMRREDPEQAEALYRMAIQAGHVDWSAHAACSLGDLLNDKGDFDGAKAAWQQVIDSRNPDWAGNAFLELINLLAAQDDADGLRAAYTTGAALEIPDALYALTQLGQVLEAQGDIDGAHQAWQQAIDAGCEDPDYWRERISPLPPRPRPEPAPYPDDLPSEFNPENMTRTGIHVLEHGLPALPETLTYDMAIPVAYWQAEQCAVVLVLRFSQDDPGRSEPMELQVTYTRAPDGSWIPPKHAAGGGFGYDPIANADGGLYGLDGRAIVYSGGSQAATITPGQPACTAVGQAAPEVKYLALIKEGREDRRQLDSHFGAWVVCTEQDGSFEVAGLDSQGTRLGSLQLP